MKVYSFLVSLVISLTFLGLLAMGATSASAIQAPITTHKPSVELPNAAKFFPKDASFTIHWMPDNENGEEFNYLTHSSKAIKGIDQARRLMSGLFALTGLDFDAELAGWIGSNVSLAFFETNEIDKPLDWIIALSSINKDGAKDFLHRYWGKEALAGVNVEVENYRGIGIIGSNAILGEDISPQKATTLINNNLLLIASNKRILKKSLDLSQKYELNQLGDKRLKESMLSIESGNALITISQHGLNSLFSMPIKFSQRTDFNGFTGSVKFNKSNITLDGIFQSKTQLKGIEAEQEESLSLLQGTSGPAEAVIIIKSSSELLRENNQEPLHQLVRPLIRKELQKVKGLTPKAITSLNKGPLIWIQEPAGWVLGTQKDKPTFEVIDEFLKQQGENPSELMINKKTFKVWSKLVPKNNQNNYTLETELGAILSEDSDNNWWAETLEAMQQREETGAEVLQAQLKDIIINNKQFPEIALLLNSNQAENYLNKWDPWLLLQTVSDSSLKSNIQGLALTINPDENQTGIALRTSLDIS